MSEATIPVWGVHVNGIWATRRCVTLVAGNVLFRTDSL
jgi:hypothetical protein